VQSLQEKGIASPAELDAAQTNFTAQKSRLELANAQVEQREAALKSANIRLSYTALVTTEPGFIGERYVDEGSLLAPNAPVVSIIGIDTVIVQTTVIERIYGRIKIGQTAEVQVDAYPTKRFAGKVARIAPMLQEASRVAKMEVEVANDSLLLKPGMFTKLSVVLAQKDSAQVVPSKAVVSRAGESGVFVVADSAAIARYVPVQIGIVTPEKTEIAAPQIKGLVVTLGQHLLEDGSPVILPGKNLEKPMRKGKKE
jgi:RND family efflux transporter MFP subunit